MWSSVDTAICAKPLARGCMGIEWTLQGADAASSARNATESSSGPVVLGAASTLIVRRIVLLR